MKSVPKFARSPDGVVTNKPIYLRLLPEEHAKIEKLAKREQRSLSSVCRLALLRGLADCERSKKPLIP
jgi:hypothetical protein